MSKPYKIDHLGIAVKSIEETAKFYQEALGLTIDKIEEVPREKVKVAFLQVGESKIELLEATDPEGPIAKHIENRGEGIAHVAFAVECIHTAMEQAKAAGARLLSEEPLDGAGGAKICFIHPRSGYGVLIELCQKPS